MKSFDTWMAEALSVLTRREQIVLWMRFGIGRAPSEPIPRIPETFARHLAARALRKLRVAAVRPDTHAERERPAVVAPATFGERRRRVG
jgi:DNA-directed RNA polymerase sigma subunit (sigma70/sigma32)